MDKSKGTPNIIADEGILFFSMMLRASKLTYFLHNDMPLCCQRPSDNNASFNICSLIYIHQHTFDYSRLSPQTLLTKESYFLNCQIEENF